MCSSNAPCTCVCCSSDARSARRRGARMAKLGVTGPREYLRAGVHERIRQVRAGEVDIATGLSDPDPAVQFEAELLTSTGPDYSKMDRERLEKLAREADNADVLADIYVEAARRGDNWVMLYVAGNKHTNPDTLRACERSGLPAARAAALNRLYELRMATAEELTSTGNVSQRMAVAKRCAPALVELMVSDPSPRVRREVARRPLPHSAALRLAGDSDIGVRRALLDSTDDKTVLSWFADDDELADTARERLATLGFLDDFLDGLFG